MNDEHLKLLGLKAKDVVTGIEGIVTSINYDLYGCIQALVQPPKDKNGEIPTSHWFDVTRVKVLGRKPVMALPDFQKGYVAEGRKGAANKPIPN